MTSVSWLMRDALERFGSLLRLGGASRLLNVACGSGWAVANGNRMATEQKVDQRVSFMLADAGQPLKFDGASFDAILCVDAINHLRDRAAVLADWAVCCAQAAGCCSPIRSR